MILICTDSCKLHEYCLRVHFRPLLLLSICSSVRCYSAREEACEAHLVSTLNIRASVIPSEEACRAHYTYLLGINFVVLLGDMLWHINRLVYIL